MQVAFVNPNHYFDINNSMEASVACGTWGGLALGQVSGVVLPLPLRGTV